MLQLTMFLPIWNGLHMYSTEPRSYSLHSAPAAYYSSCPVVLIWH